MGVVNRLENNLVFLSRLVRLRASRTLWIYSLVNLCLIVVRRVWLLGFGLISIIELVLVVSI